MFFLLIYVTGGCTLWGNFKGRLLGNCFDTSIGEKHTKADIDFSAFVVPQHVSDESVLTSFGINTGPVLRTHLVNTFFPATFDAEVGYNGLNAHLRHVGITLVSSDRSKINLLIQGATGSRCKFQSTNLFEQIPHISSTLYKYSKIC